MTPIRVLLVCRQLDAGGSERQLSEIAKALDRSRFDPRVACFRPGGLRFAELEAAGVPIFNLELRSFHPGKLIPAVLRFRDYLRREQITIVHCFDPPANIFGVPAARLAGVPVVLSSQRSFRSLRTPRQRFLLRLTDKLAHGVVVNSAAVRHSLIEEEGIPPARIHLCYNGIDVSRFHRRSAARPPAALLTIGTLCVLRPEKGLDTLVRAFAELHQHRPATRLRITGSGPLEQPLKDLVRSLGLDEVCTFQPATAHVAEEFDRLDIFVLASLSEALSNSLMEAMACGVCPVASQVGGNPELVTNGETGLLFRPGDFTGLSQALLRLVDDPVLRSQLAANASDRIHQGFTVRVSASQMGALYDRCVSSATPNK